MSARLTAADIQARSARNKAAWNTPVGTLTPPAPYIVANDTEREVKPNKYGAIKTSAGDSKKEVRRLQELRLLEAAGQITQLIPQVRYRLVPAQHKADGSMERAITYTCDAQYIEAGKLVIEDCKSEPTRKLPAFIHKRKLMLQIYGIEVREV